MAHTALVIGAQGVIGTFIAREFAAAGWRVTRAGRRTEDASDFRLIDLDDPADLRQACARVDLVVNTAHHPELAPQRTVLRQGGTLIDLTELAPPERRKLASMGSEGPGLVVADTGLGGLAYLAIADLLREHPETDTAEYALMVSANGSSGRAGALFAHGLLTGSSHHPSAKIPFPEPSGESRCLQVGGVLREQIGEVPLRHYLCMQPRALHRMLLALNGARLIGILPKASFTSGTRKVPAEPSREEICELVAVSRGGERIATQTLSGRGYYRMTAAATLVFGEALLGGRDATEAKGAAARGKSGLRSIDELITLDDVRPAAIKHGIAIEKQTTARAA
ncbi:MAG TPA: NAD-dependent epimerase/dehydratase family protein [Solirubrobacteraceae bacterium]|nr:NAD-dependent epimerase/dehydratase family protein [Solirubrobacteraceae bacterium]